ncbi:hypothetical protein U1Q18_036854, partial [Sarracenia purpurea var. burkii]
PGEGLGKRWGAAATSIGEGCSTSDGDQKGGGGSSLTRSKREERTWDTMGGAGTGLSGGAWDRTR